MYKLRTVFIFILSTLLWTNCSDNNDLLIEESFVVSRNHKSNQSTAFITEIQDYISNKSKGFQRSIEKRFGEIYWDFAVVTSSEDHNQIFSMIPLVGKKTKYTDAIMVAHKESLHEKPKFYFIKRSALDQLQKKHEVDLSQKPKDLPYETVLLNLINFDQSIFGQADCELVDRAEELYENFQSDRRQKSYICYVVLNEIYTDWYQYNSYTGQWEYLDTSVSYGYVGDVCIDIDTGGIPGGDPNGGSTGGGSSSSNDPNIYDNIDPSAVLSNPEINCLYNLFMEGNYSLFNQTIRAFEDTDDVDLIFKLTTGSPRTDTYQLERDNKITIYLNPDEAESTLDLADQILHEGVHAAIAVYLNERNVDVTLYNRDRLRELYDFYKGYNNPNYQDHIYMAENYIEPIASVLRSLDNNNYPLNHYYGIVWEGLGYWNQNYPELVSQYGNSHQYNSTVRNNTTLCD